MLADLTSRKLHQVHEHIPQFLFDRYSQKDNNVDDHHNRQHLEQDNIPTDQKLIYSKYYHQGSNEWNHIGPYSPMFGQRLLAHLTSKELSLVHAHIPQFLFDKCSQKDNNVDDHYSRQHLEQGNIPTDQKLVYSKYYRRDSNGWNHIGPYPPMFAQQLLAPLISKELWLVHARIPQFLFDKCSQMDNNVGDHHSRQHLEQGNIPTDQKLIYSKYYRKDSNEWNHIVHFLQ